MKRFTLLLFLPLMLCCSGNNSPKAPELIPVKSKTLLEQLEKIIASKKADVGVAVMHLENEELLSINGSKPYIMMSVVKFPVALAILREVDLGRLHLDQNLHFAKSDLKEDTHSPMRGEHKGEKTFDLPLLKVLEYSVSVSDNNACDKLLALLGGPKATEDSLTKMGASGVHISYNYAKMRIDSLIGNNSTPSGMLMLLKQFYQDSLLSESSRQLLLKIMENTPSGPNRIKGLLPAGTVVAHKTGTYFTDDSKNMEAYNDAGIITLPDGNHFALVVFVNNSKEQEEKTAAIIAELAKACWDYYSSK